MLAPWTVVVDESGTILQIANRRRQHRPWKDGPFAQQFGGCSAIYRIESSCNAVSGHAEALGISPWSQQDDAPDRKQYQ